MKRYLALILLLLVSPSLLFAEAVPLSDLLNAADDYWKTSTPQRPVLIQGGNIKTTQQYVSVPTSSTMGLVGYASGAAALGGLAFYQHTGKDPVTALVDGLHHVFQPVWIAFQENFVTPESFPASAAQYVGAEAALFSKISDIVDFVKSAPENAFSYIRSLIDNFSTDPVIDDSLWGAGTVIPLPDGRSLKFSNFIWNGPGIITQSTLDSSIEIYPSSSGTKYIYNASSGLLQKVGPKIDNLGGGRYYPSYSTSVSIVTDPVTSPAIPGSVDIPGLAEEIKNNPTPELNTDLAEIIKNLPSTQVNVSVLIPSSPVSSGELDHPSLSPQAIEQFFAQNASQVSTKSLEVANDPLATPEQVAAAQVAANAAAQVARQAQAQMEPSPETYSDVPLSGFTDPYNPGPFDIPDRFDTFLSNVAATGLFSLPSQYFNSLPGGGSPTYTIEAGQYGTHTVDLNETMGTGLAVLKTVLLLCFAFLSVRVVVLKR